MLFNSVEFICWFLPATLLFYFFIARPDRRAPALAALVLASLVFYSWWDWHNLLVLIPSVLANYALGRAISAARQSGRRRTALAAAALGVALDLAAIGYFKYANFAVTVFAEATGFGVVLQQILLPLGISFFTFQQIKFLVDVYTGATAPPSFLRYALLVSFFPHVIAGPIVHYDDLLPQFDRERVYRFSPAEFADGIAFFLLGLAKKVVLADQFGVYANEGFAAAAHGHSLTFFAAWGAALAYTLQLYFDFSGYSDMAFGLARMFGLRFPINFNSPYKAASIIDFWRRWHITLSTFLRDYLYIPLGGNRRGKLRRYVNLMLTMLLGGLWHGAGWTFVFWGALHGGYIVANHGWIALRRKLVPSAPSPLGRLAGQGLTLLAVIIAWVFFRADSFAAATAVLDGMAGAHGALLPSQLIEMAPVLRHIAGGAGTVPFLAGETVLGFVEMVAMLGLGSAIALGAPNLYEMSPRARLLLLLPSFGFTVQKIFFAQAISPFLYFRF